MKAYLPKSSSSWLLVAIILSFSVIQILTVMAASRFAEQSSRSADMFRLAETTLNISRALATRTGPDRFDLLDQMKSSGLRVSLDQRSAVPSAVAGDDDLAELEDILLPKLSSYGVSDLRVAFLPAVKADGLQFSIEKSDDSGPLEADLSKVSERFARAEQFVVSAKTSAGDWLNLALVRSPAPAISTRESLPYYIAACAAAVALCFLAIYRLTAPYRKIADALLALGQNINEPPLQERGGAEYSQVAKALNLMQAQLKEYVNERELLAASLAHDLRTPLTRTKLRLALLRDGKSRAALGSDIRDIEIIINSVLEYARADMDQEEWQTSRVYDIVEDVCRRYGGAVLLHPSFAHESRARCKPVQLARGLRNIIDNAIAYGNGAEIAVNADATVLDIVVSDRGPGIPQEEFDKVVKPFYRLAGADRKAVKGSGLGLAIAARIVKVHDGSLELRNRQGGGLEVHMRLPLLAN